MFCSPAFHKNNFMISVKRGIPKQTQFIFWSEIKHLILTMKLYAAQFRVEGAVHPRHQRIVFCAYWFYMPILWRAAIKDSIPTYIISPRNNAFYALLVNAARLKLPKIYRVLKSTGILFARWLPSPRTRNILYHCI